MKTTRTLWAVLLLAGCASIQRVQYTPDAARSADPRAEIAALIKANVRQGCIAEPAFEGTLLQVKFVCNEAIGNQVARLDRIKSVYLEQYQEWYRVVVQHTAGDDFTWSSKSLEDVQRLADAFTALGKPAAADAPKNTTSI